MSGATDFSDLLADLFPPSFELTHGVNELYELRLARLELGALSPNALRERSAYFAKVLGKPTNHYLLCSGAPLDSPDTPPRSPMHVSPTLFKTGYATHGLFPYRGKFHPQMVKGLINIMGVEPGETILDPMMGSGTVLIEAAVMGIDSVGIDASPLCLLMAQAKLDGLTVAPALLERYLATPLKTFDRLAAGEPVEGAPLGAARLLRLAHLDAMSYAARRKGKRPRQVFATVLKRYVAAVRKFHDATAGRIDIGRGLPAAGDARRLPLADSSVHGVLFSPPYSFAVDYIDSDTEQLEHLGVDPVSLRERMVGLRGQGTDKVDLYFRDMASIMREVARVLAPGRRCCVVVGSNTRQLERLLGEEHLRGIEDRLVDIGMGCGLRLLWRTKRLVTGIANSMRDEHILIFETEAGPGPIESDRQLKLL